MEVTNLCLLYKIVTDSYGYHKQALGTLAAKNDCGKSGKGKVVGRRRMSFLPFAVHTSQYFAVGHMQCFHTCHMTFYFHFRFVLAANPVYLSALHSVDWCLPDGYT